MVSKLICVLLIIILLYLIFGNTETMKVSEIDGEMYPVVDTFDNSNHAANIIANINADYVRLIKHMRNNCMDTIWAPNILYLCQNYDPTRLGEHIPLTTNNTSFVLNKGKKVRFCLRRIDNRNKFYDDNTITFVALHELSHMMTHEFGHGQKFWDCFTFVLGEAKKIKMIKIIDYKKNPQEYCGISIDRNPAIDKITIKNY